MTPFAAAADATKPAGPVAPEAIAAAQRPHASPPDSQVLSQPIARPEANEALLRLMRAL